MKKRRLLLCPHEFEQLTNLGGEPAVGLENLARFIDADSSAIQQPVGLGQVVDRFRRKIVASQVPLQWEALGKWDTVTLREARELRDEWKKILAKGMDAGTVLRKRPSWKLSIGQ